MQHALIDTICSEKTYQLGRIFEFTGSSKNFFRKFDKKSQNESLLTTNFLRQTILYAVLLGRLKYNFIGPDQLAY